MIIRIIQSVAALAVVLASAVFAVGPETTEVAVARSGSHLLHVLHADHR